MRCGILKDYNLQILLFYKYNERTTSPMNTSVLFLPPETLEGHIIAYHPFCDIICAAGSVDSDGAIVWLVP